jgi:hypothetical protein
MLADTLALRKVPFLPRFPTTLGGFKHVTYNESGCTPVLCPMCVEWSLPVFDYQIPAYIGEVQKTPFID